MMKFMMQEASGWLEKRTHGQLLVLLAALFTAVHVGYYALGLRFDASPLDSFWQYLDPVLLKNDLLTSCFYLHSQPPLFNLFLGVVLKISPVHFTTWFWAIYLSLGMVFYLTLFYLLRRLGVSRAAALMMATLFVATPSFILYEHWLFYTFPLAVFLLFSAWLLYAMLSKNAHWPAYAFFGVLFVLGGVRTLFHLVYFIAVTGFLLVLHPQRAKMLMTAAFVPFMLLLGLNLKNAVVFHKFTTSTWFGMNLWTMTARNLPLPERQRLVTAGELSPVSLVERFSAVEAYPPALTVVTGHENIPALQQSWKSTGGKNFNHQAYIAISDQYLRDSLAALRHHPRSLVIGLLRSWFGYFKSSSDYVLLSPNLSKLGVTNKIWDTLLYGRIPYDLTRVRWLPIYSDGSQHVYLFLFIGLPLLLVFGVRAGFGKNRTGAQLGQNQRLVVLYLCVNIVFVAVVGNTFEVGENNRFRFMTDPFAFILFALFVTQTFGRYFSARKNPG